MEIDVFTTIAQLINFVLLALLLKRFLYRPIVRTMDERERQITERIDGAEERERRARQEADACHRERRMLEDTRGALLSEAQAEADQWKQELMNQSRTEIEATKLRWQTALEREKETFLADLRRRAGEEVYTVIRRALSDLAGVDLERRIAEHFAVRITDIPESKWKEIIRAAAQSHDRVVVSSAFELDAGSRKLISAAIRRQMTSYGAGEFAIEFSEQPDLISGIELIAGGQRAAWSLENYLETLEENVGLAFRVGGTEEADHDRTAG